MPATKAGNIKAGITRRRNTRDPNNLTAKQRAFVLHYLGAAKRVGTEAAVLAGYGGENRDQARRTASELLGRPGVIAAIEEVTARRAAKLEVTAEDVLRDLLLLKTDAELLGKNVQVIRARREILKDIGDHVAVGAFKRQLGLSGPNGGPIETVDVAALANLSDEELEQLERARAILDRVAGRDAKVSDSGGDQGGEGAPPEGE